MPILDSIRLSGTSYNLKDNSATTVVEITQNDYDNLPSTAKTANILYVITDAQPIDISEYWTSAETQSAITESVSGKADSSSLATVATSGSYNDLIDKPTIPTVPTSNTAFTNDARYITSDDISGKTDTSAFTAHTADTTAHTTSAEKSSWNGAVTALGGMTILKLSQAQYDALDPNYDSNTLYVIVN